METPNLPDPTPTPWVDARSFTHHAMGMTKPDSMDSVPRPVLVCTTAINQEHARTLERHLRCIIAIYDTSCWDTMLTLNEAITAAKEELNK